MVLRLLLALSLLLSPGRVFADELLAKPLKTGEPAPFDGQLLSPLLAAGLAVKAQDCDRRVQVETQFAAKMGIVEGLKLRGENEIKEANLALCHADLAVAKAEATPPFWEKPAFVAVATFALTCAGTYAVLRGVGALEK